MYGEDRITATVNLAVKTCSRGARTGGDWFGLDTRLAQGRRTEQNAHGYQPKESWNAMLKSMHDGPSEHRRFGF